MKWLNRKLKLKYFNYINKQESNHCGHQYVSLVTVKKKSNIYKK